MSRIYMVNIALCFSGQPRFINSLDLGNFFSNYNVDIYAHFWWNNEYRGTKVALNSDVAFPEDYNPIELFIKKFDPKKISYESYREIDLSNFKLVSLLEDRLKKKIVKESIYRQKSQWISVDESFKLIDNPSYYDVIVRARSDLIFTKAIDFSDLSDNTIYFMDGSIEAGVGREFCDWFYFGTANSIANFKMLDYYDDF